MGNRKIAGILSIILLAAVLWQQCGVFVFPHTHHIGNTVITHSHPYSGTPDNPKHTHNAIQFHTIALLSSFALLLGVGVTIAAVTAAKTIVRKVSCAFLSDQYDFLSLSLRAPPCC